MMKCSREDCNEEAGWRIELVLRSSMDGTPAIGSMGLVVCFDHKDEVLVDDVLSDDTWKRIVDAMQEAGARLPVRDLTTAVTVPIS
jgi:hypothetical protein